uniref:SAM domain-containing protein n=1 Tax=Heliothis virescens TaxID=7102 RepID=A0A2A4JDA3_HELVI
MQQPLNQPESIGGQQGVQQQMVLCPVRFVYETQVLVQPDQIQPNQTFFINPQNPPPWMQNRPAPNPVVYVQQLPNNMVHPVQQQMDPNQMFLQQNFANFQLQQHMLAQNHQDMRPAMQLANIVPNMVQNVQQNIQTNDRNINQNPNTGQIQANTQTVMQNQMTVARQVQNTNNQAVEVQRQVFMNVRPQMSQQMNIARPVMSLNQIQNMQAMANMQNIQIQQANAGQQFVQNIGPRLPQNVNAVRPQMMGNNNMQAMANMQNIQIQQANAGQQFVQNIGPRLPQNVNAVRPQMMGNNVINVQNVMKQPPQQNIQNVNVNKPPQEPPKVMNNNVASPVPNVRNFAQNYNCRPIQPRRRVENNSNVPKMLPQSVPIQPQHIPVQTPPTQYNQEKVNSHQIVTNIAANTTYLNNPSISRKRKSESPDEIQNKMAVPPASKPIYKNLQQGIIITKISNEMGTNTSPVHKPNVNVASPSVPIIPTTPMVIVESKDQKDVNVTTNVTESRTVMTPVMAPSESDKLIRNTVFTQARGRLLQDRISDTLPPQVLEVKPPESVQMQTGNTAKQPEKVVSAEVKTVKETVMTETPTEKVTIAPVQTEKVTIAPIQTERAPVAVKQPTPPEIVAEKPTKIQEKKPKVKDDKVQISEQVKTEIKIEMVQEEKMEVIEQNAEVKDEKVEATEKVITKQDILTHVVDGYVIQESNFAFPIRKPLIEKTQQANAKPETEATDALKECMKEEMKNTGVDVQLLPFHYLLLHCEKKKEEEEEKEDSTKKNPFSDLVHSTVKSWTVEDLSNHLLKFNWEETVSVFQDHEIDGESLFLVSKTQLNRYRDRNLLESSAAFRLCNLKANNEYNRKYKRQLSRNCNCKPIHKRILRHQIYFNNDAKIANESTINKYTRSLIDKEIELLDTDSEENEEITAIFEGKMKNYDNYEKTEIEAKSIVELEVVKDGSDINEGIGGDDSHLEANNNEYMKAIGDSGLANSEDITGVDDFEQISIENQETVEEYTEDCIELNNNSKHKLTQNIAPENDNISPEVDHSINVNENKLDETKNDEDKPFDDFKVPKEIPRRNIAKKKACLKPEPQFILTHVLDGHIIQESNYPFPVSNTTKENPPKTPQEDVATSSTARIDEQNLLEESGNGNPFARLQKSTVKSWTAEDLSSHLIKFNWSETAEILKDNEIDGETLFLVSKTQLAIIGVDEEQAEVICEFIQKDSC